MSVPKARNASFCLTDAMARFSIVRPKISVGKKLIASETSANVERNNLGENASHVPSTARKFEDTPSAFESKAPVIFLICAANSESVFPLLPDFNQSSFISFQSKALLIPKNVE